MAGGTGVAVMYDIDFLLAARTGDLPVLDRAVVYRYRSGVLRQRLHSVLYADVERRGAYLQTGRLPLKTAFFQNSLISCVMYYAWPARTSRAMPHSDLLWSLDRLARNAYLPSIHFVDRDSPVGRHPGWASVEREALVIEEPVISRRTVKKILHYLEATTDLLTSADLVEQPGFVASFLDLVDDGITLPALMQAFEERVLLCTDPVTNRYDASRYRAADLERHGRRALLPHLHNLAALRREGDLLDLLCGFDQRRAERGWSAHELASELYRLTEKLLHPVAGRRRPRYAARSRVAEHRATEGAVLWAALVLAGEDALIRGVCEDRAGYRRGPDLIVPILAALGRDFLARHGRAEADDPLDGRWTHLVRTLHRCGAVEDPGHALARSRGGLVQALAAALACTDGGPSWFGVVAREAAVASARFNESRDRCVSLDHESGTTQSPDKEVQDGVWMWPTGSPRRSLASVIGRQHAVNGLWRHARDRTSGVNVLLHGPAGVGKRTLARIFAQMILCKAPLPNGDACGKCQTCLQEDPGNAGCIEIDGADPRIEDLSRQLSNKIRFAERMSSGHPLPSRFVFIVANAERYPPEAFDHLLAPMEDSGRACFVLLARDRRRVRIAGQSRSFDYRVRPLDRSNARRFLQEVAGAQRGWFDEAFLESFIDVGAGLPGRLLEAWARVSAVVAPDPVAIRKALELDWGEALVAVWPAILSGMPMALEDLVERSGADRAEWVGRIRAVLHALYVDLVAGGAMGRPAFDSALRQLPGSVRAELGSALVRQAARWEVTVAAAWRRSVAVWMSDGAQWS